MPATGVDRLITTSLPEFLLLLLEPNAVLAMDAVKCLHSVVVCYDVQDFYKRYDVITRPPTASEWVGLDEFLYYCVSKIPAEFVAAGDEPAAAGYRCCMTVTDLMRMDAWIRLYDGVGPYVMKYLLHGCVLFVPLDRNVYYCVRGPPHQAGQYEVLQSFRAWAAGSRRNERAKPSKATAASFTVAGLLTAAKPICRGTDADDMMREIILQAQGCGDDETGLAALKCKLKVMADRDSLQTCRSIYKTTVGDPGQGEIPLCRVKRFATAVVRKIVPRQLFGAPANRDRYCDNLCKVLNFGMRHAFTAQHIVHGVKTTKVGWLKSVDAAQRTALLTGTLVWLTNSFVFNRILHFFRVVWTDTPSHGIAYFDKTRWAALCHAKISPLIDGEGGGSASGFFKQLVDVCDNSSHRNWNVCPYAKKPNGGVRLIFKLRQRNEHGAKQLMDHCLTFLRCLARTYPSEFRSVSRPQFFRGWTALQRERQDHRSSSMYYVRTDFRDAFTSFRQGKLLAVVWQRINERFGNRSQTLRVHSVDVVKVGGGGTVYCKKRKYCDGLPVPNFPAGSLVFYDGTTAVPLDRIWDVVRKCVRCNAVEWRGRRWAMTRGVVQGDRLSVALCDLLLADLQATHLQHAVGDGCGQLYRFVDDYVFVSHDRTAASRFLAAMCAGFDEYGLRLNHSKTETNLVEDGGSGETVKFLGFRLNPSTGEVTKDVSAYRNQRPLHFFDYELGRGFCGRTLYAKVTRPNQHPLPVALVCKSFNSVSTVARNLAFIVAHKAFAVIAAIKQYFFHLNPAFVLKTVHAIARLMYGKVCGLIRRSAVTPSQCKWIVYEVYATMFQVHFSDCDSRINCIVDQLRRYQSAVGHKCNDRILKMALNRCGFAKIFG